jgi:hypothetical protein
MLFSGMEGVVVFGGVGCNTRTATIVVRAIKVAATANRAAILRRLVIEARIACNFAPSECGPAGRAAGSIANIEINNEMKRRGTCAAFSCSIGNGFDRRASRISSTVRPLKSA